MRRFHLIVMPIVFFVAACSFPGVHKNAIEQGNRLIPERVERLEIGMTRDQVQFLLGSPITVNTFDPNRWIYLERIDFDRKVRENTYLIINFNANRVSEIQRETGGSPSDPLSKVDTTPPDRRDEGLWWWPF